MKFEFDIDSSSIHIYLFSILILYDNENIKIPFLDNLRLEIP